MATNLKKRTQPKHTPPAAISYEAIRARAKDMEADTVRFLSDLVRTQSFSSKERDVIAVIRREMSRSALTRSALTGWATSSGGSDRAGA